MPASPPANMPRITPNIHYDDLASALDWLSKAFGFETRMALPGPDGKMMHAEMTVADSAVMMSCTSRNSEWKSPQSQGGAVTQSLYIYVDNVDAHQAVAKQAGGTIMAELEDMFWGDRIYVVADLEGHRWTFAEHTREMLL